MDGFLFSRVALLLHVHERVVLNLWRPRQQQEAALEVLDVVELLIACCGRVAIRHSQAWAGVHGHIWLCRCSRQPGRVPWTGGPLLWELSTLLGFGWDCCWFLLAGVASEWESVSSTLGSV